MRGFHEFTPDTPVRTISGRTGRPLDLHQVERTQRDARTAQQASASVTDGFKPRNRGR